MAIMVVRAGMFTTVQDLGRREYRAAGVPLGGAVDPFALRLVNLLVGNAEDAAALEFTLVGPELEFASDVTIALGGGDFGRLPRWQPLRVRAGERVKLGAANSGCRGYLAVAGGFDVPVVLGGRGTYMRAALGGVEGRALRDGDVLRADEISRPLVGRWRIDERILPAYSAAPTVRVVRGAQGEEFGDTFTSVEFKVTAKSDRMGARLSGPIVAREVVRESVSTTVVPGTVQVPPDGQPIVLLADAQTIGGYPQIAHVVTVDLPLVAQLRPGDTVRFCEVSLAEAHDLIRVRERAMAMLREGLAQKYAGGPLSHP
jgi:antagonist of KipI